MQNAFGDIAGTGYGEVPGQVELVSAHACVVQRTEQIFHLRAACFDGFVAGFGVVAVGAKHFGGFQKVAVTVAQVAQGNNVALAALELAHGANDERLLGRVVGVGVELTENQVLLTGAGAYDHYR